MNECKRTEEHLVDYLDGALPAPDRSALENHLTSCGACRDTVRSYQRIQSAYRSVPDTDVDERLAEQVLASARGDGPRRPKVIPWALMWAAAAALLVILIVRGISGSTPEAQPDLFAERLQEGDAQRDAGKLERALSLYAQALNDAGEDGRGAQALHRLGAVHQALGQHEQARERLDLLVRDYPGYDERSAALLLLGESCELLGETGQAIQAYRLVAKEFPDDQRDAERRVRALEQSLSTDDMEALTGLGYVGDD